jgi:hypothetical protein
MNPIVYVCCSARVHVFLHLGHLQYARQNPKLNTQLQGRELPAGNYSVQVFSCAVYIFV